MLVEGVRVGKLAFFRKAKHRMAINQPLPLFAGVARSHPLSYRKGDLSDLPACNNVNNGGIK